MGDDTDGCADPARGDVVQRRQHALLDLRQSLPARQAYRLRLAQPARVQVAPALLDLGRAQPLPGTLVDLDEARLQYGLLAVLGRNIPRCIERTRQRAG